MYKIPTLLDAAKENNDLKSDRELAKLLGVANITPYRNRGAIPSDETAKKLADLTGVSYELVLASCHGATAKKNNDPEALKAWRNMFKMAQSMALVFMVSVCSLLAYIPKAEASVYNVASVSNVVEYIIYYVIF